MKVRNGHLTRISPTPRILVLVPTLTASLNTVLSIHSLSEAGFTSADSITVGSGIPLNHYFDGASVNQANIDRKMKVFDREVTVLGGGDIPEPEIGFVFPEALSGWVDVCIGCQW